MDPQIPTPPPPPELDRNSLENREKLQQEFRVITERRERELQEEKRQEQEHKQQKKLARQSSDQSYMQMVTEEHERAEGREEWRQDRHHRIRDEEQNRKRKEREREEEQERKKKAADADRKRMESLHELHVRAMEKKRKDLNEHIEKEEGDVKHNAQHILDRNVHEIDLSLEHRLSYLGAEGRRRQMLLTRDADLRRAKIIEARHWARKEADSEHRKAEAQARTKNQEEHDRIIREARTEEGQKQFHAESTYKRDMMALEENLQEKLQEIAFEFGHLEEEAKADASRRKGAQEHTASEKTGRAAIRRANREEWMRKTPKNM